MPTKRLRRSKAKSSQKLKATVKVLEGSVHRLEDTVHKTEETTHALESELDRRGSRPRKRRSS